MRVELITNPTQISGKDLLKIKEFDDEDIASFFHDPFTFNLGIVFDEKEEIVGIGVIRIVTEFKMAVKKESHYKTAKIIKGLMGSALTLNRCNEVIIEITKDKSRFCNILERHFKFRRDTGKMLRLEL